MNGGLGLGLRLGLGGAGGVFNDNAMANAKTLMIGGQDTSILFIGDSTGNATNEWIFLFAEWLGTEYPAQTVEYRLWNNTTDVYGTPTTIQTGGGSGTLVVYNASVGGANTALLLGDKYTPAIENITPDAVIINHGHNETSGTSPSVIRGAFISLIESVLQTHPTAPITTVLQNPDRDDDDMTQIFTELNKYAADRHDMSLIDVNSLFVAEGKDPGLYVDNIHPSTGADSGTTLFVEAAQSLWNKTKITASPTSASWFDSIGTNLLDNGDFAAFESAIPDDWEAVNSPTLAKELTIVDRGSYSVEISGTNANPLLRQTIGSTELNLLKGNQATLAVRVYIPAGSPASVGRISLVYVKDGTQTTTTRSVSRGQDGWMWACISGLDIPSDATNVRVFLSSDTSASAGNNCYYDRAILVVGDVPFDMA